MGELNGKRVVVMGLGRFGGGAGATRWLVEQGADVLVTDLAGEAALGGALEAIGDLVSSGAVRLRLGEHNVSDFTDADMIIANPAVPRPWENRFLRSAEAAKVRLSTEVELLVRRLPSRDRVIGVTGTSGKSTTSAMIAHVLREAGLGVRLGGNIGGSLLGELGSIGADEWVVLELSSAQLHWINGWSPRVAVVTNLSPNHLDWHGTMMHYAASKRRLVAWQREGDAALLGPGAEGWALRPGVRRLEAGDLGGAALRVPGAHNRANAGAALAVAEAMGVEHGVAVATLEGFGGLAHRLELVGEHRGVRFYNDSKCTTPEACALAIGAFGGVRVHVIVGGYDKGVDLSGLAEAARSCASVHAIGATGAAIAGMLGDAGVDRGTLGAAFEAAAAGAREGDVVLLSPGCASWDQFENYEQRGAAFREMVERWAQGERASLQG